MVPGQQSRPRRARVRLGWPGRAPRLQSKQQILDKITGARDKNNDKGRVIQQNLAIAVQNCQNNSQSSENMNALEACRQKVDDLEKQKQTLKGELLDKDWIELTAELDDRNGWTPAMQKKEMMARYKVVAAKHAALVDDGPPSPAPLMDLLDENLDGDAGSQAEFDVNDVDDAQVGNLFLHDKGASSFGDLSERDDDEGEGEGEGEKGEVDKAREEKSGEDDDGDDSDEGDDSDGSSSSSQDGSSTATTNAKNEEKKK